MIPWVKWQGKGMRKCARSSDEAEDQRGSTGYQGLIGIVDLLRLYLRAPAENFVDLVVSREGEKGRGGRVEHGL
jgi:hypothetical protein